MKTVLLSLLTLMQINAYATEAFVAHEWGTFTSVQGSNGIPLGGMSHEEESLPSFVVGRNVLNEAPDPRCRRVKGMPMCDGVLQGIDFLYPVSSAYMTQKMETPVLYFHSPNARQVSVDIGFPQGLITQYYPAPTSFTPKLGRISGLQGGSVHYDVSVLNGTAEIPEVDPTNVYAPARNVDANFVNVGGESEKFLFYRGLGNFATTVSVSSIGGSLAIRNAGGDAAPAVFLLEVNKNGGGFVKALGRVDGLGQKTVTQNEINTYRASSLGQDEFLRQAMGALNEGLVASGLYRDEAEAMTNTWKNSYFRNPGLRVLYVLPRSETEALLPMTMTPQPQELVRTLVGRIEVMTDVDESILLTLAQGHSIDLANLGRFADPKLRRLLSLTREQSTVDYLLELSRLVQ